MSHMAGQRRCVTAPICSQLLRLFSFLQVNSDKIYWQRNKDGTFTQIYSEKKTVGHFISTKAVGSDERNDITHLYKHPEGIHAYLYLKGSYFKKQTFSGVLV